MSKPIDESILRKIRKALNTAAPNSGASEHEKETAMLLAQRLMIKHGIEMSDVQDINTDPANARKKEVVHGFGTERERKVWWKGRLASVIGDNFRCYVYFSHYYGGTMQVRFLGLKEDVEVAIEVFRYACEVIEYHAKQYLKERKKRAEKAAGLNFKNMTVEELEMMGFGVGVDVDDVRFQYSHDEAIYKMRLIMAIKDAMGVSINPTALKNDYINGFISGLADKFKEQVNKEGWGLILVKDALVQREFDGMKLKRGSASSIKSLGDMEARAAGYAQGKKFNGAPKGKLNEGQRQLKG